MRTRSFTKLVIAGLGMGFVGVAAESHAANEIYLANGTPTELFRLDVSDDAIGGTFLHAFTTASKRYHALAVPPGEDTVIAVERDGVAVVEVTDLAGTPTETKLCDLPVDYSQQVVQLAYSPSGVLYATRRDTDEMFTLDLTVGCTPLNIAKIKDSSGATVNVDGVDIVFTRGGTLFLASNPTGKLYTVTPTIDTGTGAYIASEVGSLTVTPSNTGLAVTAGGQLLISNRDDNIYDLNQTNAVMDNARNVDLDPDPDLLTALDLLGGDLANQVRLSILIDIKPGGDPNSINIDKVGQVPVAILSSDTFDATTCDPATVTLAGGEVRLIGKGDKFQAGVEDVNNDGLLDLVVHIDTADWLVEEGDAEAELTATCDGLEVVGSDSIRIVPPE